jgi:hypothetical protein
MSNPTPNDMHQDRALTDVSIEYIMNPADYIAGQVFGSTGVSQKTNVYHTYEKNDWLRSEVRTKSRGDDTPLAGYNTGTDSYKCATKWLGTDYYPEDLANADEVFSVESDKARFISQQLMQERENEFASTFMTTSVWGTDLTPSTLWDDDASDPKADLITGAQTIKKNTGKRPNTLVVTEEIHDVFTQHPLIIDQNKYTSSDSIDTEMIKRYFGIERYFVMGAIKATNVEGGTAAYDYVEDANALLCYVNPAGLNRNSVTAAHHFVWQGLTGLNSLGHVIDRYTDDSKEATIIRGKMSYDMKVVASDLGYFFNAAITS